MNDFLFFLLMLLYIIVILMLTAAGQMLRSNILIAMLIHIFKNDFYQEKSTEIQCFKQILLKSIKIRNGFYL